MKLFKVTHFDVLGHPTKLLVIAANSGAAMELAEQICGDAPAMSCIRLTRSPQ